MGPRALRRVRPWLARLFACSQAWARALRANTFGLQDRGTASLFTSPHSGGRPASLRERDTGDTDPTLEAGEGQIREEGLPHRKQREGEIPGDMHAA